MTSPQDRIAALEDALVHLTEYNVNETCLECGLIKSMQVEIGASPAYLARVAAKHQTVRAEWLGYRTHTT